MSKVCLNIVFQNSDPILGINSIFVLRNNDCLYHGIIFVPASLIRRVVTNEKLANELYQSVGLGNSELGIDHDDLIQEGSIGLLRAISLYDPDKKIKFLTYAGQAIRNAMMDLISAAFATFEQRLQSKEDGFPMERINLDDLLPGEDSMQRSELIADPYAAEPEKILIEEENRRELYEGLRRIPARDRAYLLYRFGFEDDLEHPLIGTALHFHLSESRAKSTEALALDNLWLELPWWF